MRASEKLVVLIAVGIPLIAAVLGWRMFAGWFGAPGPQAATPQLAEVAATATAAPTPQPTSPPTVAAARTVLAHEPVITPAPTALLSALPEGGDPSAAVSSFYALVSSHQFDSAVQLWTPRMRANFPPEVNLNQRFSQTQQIRLQRLDIVSQDQSAATVAVDLVESDGAAGRRHFVGNWSLVRGQTGWLLDQPQLQLAP